MATFTQKQIQHLAKLAYLNLTTKEVELYRRELAVILEFIDQLQTLDLRDIAATEQVTDLSNISRVDQLRDDLILKPEDLKLNNLELLNHQIKIAKINF